MNGFCSLFSLAHPDWWEATIDSHVVQGELPRGSGRIHALEGSGRGSGSSHILPAKPVMWLCLTLRGRRVRCSHDPGEADIVCGHTNAQHTLLGSVLRPADWVIFSRPGLKALSFLESKLEFQQWRLCAPWCLWSHVPYLLLFRSFHSSTIGFLSVPQTSQTQPIFGLWHQLFPLPDVCVHG